MWCPQFNWLCDVYGCVMSLTLGIYWVDLGFINNYKEPQLWLVLLRYSVDVASAFTWVVTYGIRTDSVIPCRLGDTIVIAQFDWLCDVCGCVMSPTLGIYWVELDFINNCKEPQLLLVLLRYSADVASAFPYWVVIYGIRVGPVIPCGLKDPQSGP